MSDEKTAAVPDTATPVEDVEISKPFDLNKHMARLLMREPFFAGLSRRVDKRACTDIPTAGVRVNPDTAQFELLYNPEFFASLSDTHKLGILKHEFYHLIFEHVTNRKPADGLKRIDNIAMDLAINSHIANELPNDANPGPMMGGKEPMKACIPGEGKLFKDLPLYKSYEWYLSALKDMVEKEKEKGEGGEGEPGESGDPFGDTDSLDSHEGFGEADGTTQEIAKERLKETLKKAAEEAEKARNWGTVSSSMRQDIMERIASKVDWRKVLRYFVKTSQRSDKRSTPRRLNKRYPRVHPGKRVRRHAKIAISIDQSGSVDDQMLAAFFSELNKLAEIAEFTVVPFDTVVAEDKVYVWKKGKTQKTERVMRGGTCFNAPTKYVNNGNFDGHIILTDLCAPKPISSKCQRMWMTTKANAARPYFQTRERIIAIDD